LLHRKGGQRVLFSMEAHHTSEINGADHIDVMDKERFFSLTGVPAKELSNFFQATTGIEQRVFAGNFDVQSKVVVFLQVVQHHVRKVVNVDDDIGYPKTSQAGNNDFEQRAAPNFHQGFGPAVGQRPEASPKARCQDHGLHCARFSRSRWRTTISSPFF
jgi:hypothetical protein